ncbi:MAG: fucose 4-O-acetylase-like acetyltransferase [Bermanella sp.]|jgi:fucose 4-O-acetylase-like acetyltransferase
MGNARNEIVDSLKGMLMILVVFGHVVYLGSNFSLFGTIREIIYIFHMPIFLFISGYFFTPVENSKSAYSIFRKLLVPYFIFYISYLFILYVITVYFSNVSTSNKVNDIYDIPFYIFIEPLSSYWYLHSLILFYCLYSFFNNLFLRFPLLIVRFLLCVFSVLGCIWVLNSLGVKVYLWVFSYLLLGVGFKILIDKFGGEFNLYLSKIRLVSLISLSISSFMFLYLSVSDIYNNGLLRMIACLGITPLLYVLVRYSSLILPLIGRSSLIIFLVHVYFLNIFKVFANSLLALDSTGTIFMLLSVLLSVIFPLFLAMFFDRINVSRILFGRKSIL